MIGSKIIYEFNEHAFFDKRRGWVVTLGRATEVVRNNLPRTQERGQPMPKTIGHYQANALRDQELILEQKDEIAKQSQTINKLRQKLESRK